ncbi:MAG: hypothetical protein D8H91_03565 [Alloprevotella sp.]|nr:MAG: hypothetical protein D8H91_03565 [Alloprevotella sp.]
MRTPSFTILKAIAIILVVIAHSAAPAYLSNFAYMVGVPAFFVLSGYFFKLDNLDNTSDFVIRRTKTLYLPFIKWGVFFLILHNLFFEVGFLSESYGNAQGGVTHPYNWTQAAQHLWSMVFNMSGYDPFMAGAFWFFRALFLANIAFIFLFKATRQLGKFKTSTLQVVSVIVLAFLLALWQASMGLHITGVAQGGYRELMGIVLLGIGFLLRRADETPDSSIWHNPIIMLAASSVVLMILTFVYPISMAAKPGSVLSVPILTVAGTAAFIWLRGLSEFILQLPEKYTQWLQFTGENSLYIFVFHLLAFKVASMIKVGVYQLDWAMVGGHPVVQHELGDGFWLLYIFVGVVLPILPVWIWKKITNQRKFDATNPKDWLRLIVLLGLLAYKGVIALGQFIINIFINLGKSIVSLLKTIWSASNPSED